MSDTLRLLALYPDRMNIYADRGNMLMLQRRCEARGIGFELAASGVGDTFDPDAHDLIYIGGGQDRDQEQIAQDLVQTKRAPLQTAIDRGAAVLAVCGGYQLLGESYIVGEREIRGLALLDFKTVREPGPRLIGNVMIEVNVSGRRELLAGFENHGGRTYLGPGAQPLGRVIHGHGNNGRDGFEGVLAGNVFGTYLHGPLLPKNSWFADHLTAVALAHGGDPLPLEPLDDEFERRAHAAAIAAARADAGSLRRPLKLIRGALRRARRTPAGPT